MSLSRSATVIVACLVCLGLLPCLSQAEVKVSGLFSDHMVLQREMPVPIWGTAAPEEKVTVQFATQTKTAVADKDGKWMVKLDALKAGGPEKLVISGTNTITIEDVLIGEVWLGSGQSNMEMGAKYFVGGDALLASAAKASYPRLRLLTSPALKWSEANEDSIQGFSALMFSFGLPLQKELDVPVGLIVGAVGGTASGMWATSRALEGDEACQTAVKKFVDSGQYDQMMKKYEADLAAWEKQVSTMPASAPSSSQPTTAGTKPAAPPRKPGPPQKPGDFGWAGGLYRQKIMPLIPYAIRGVLWDQGESGTGIVGADQFSVMGALIRSWRQDWAPASPAGGAEYSFPFLYVQKPSGGGCAMDPNDPVTCRAEKFAPQPAAVPAFDLGRELHIRIAEYPNTYMVTSSDLGAGIHPVNKSGYGVRAARVALGAVYGKKVETSGPVYKSCKVEGDKIRLQFTHVGAGLTIGRGEKLQGFAVAGEDKVFHWADAVIDGDSVVVSCGDVAKPIAVRYQGTSFCNLFNKDGLPALTFRTDSW